MTLPEIVLPKIALPFDIPVLLHPLTVHFLIAIPVVILLLELMNLVMKKKAVGGVSFFLIILTVIAAVGAYFTGLADGKEAFPTLTEAAKTALSEHKLLGTYLLLGSAGILLLKLLAMTGNKFLKALYILALIAFVIVMFNQGKDGGNLVYNHGLNVQAVKTLDDKVFDLEEALEDAKTNTVLPEVKVVPVEVSAPVVETVIEVTSPITPVETTGIETVEISAEVATPNTPMETSVQESVAVPSNIEEVVVIPETQEIPLPAAQ